MKSKNERHLELVAFLLPGFDELCRISAEPSKYPRLPILINNSKERLVEVLQSGTQLQKQKAEILMRDLENLLSLQAQPQKGSSEEPPTLLTK